MNSYTPEQVMAIGYFDKQLRNESELAIHILDSKFPMKPKALDSPVHVQLLVNIFSWTLFFVGSYFKFIIYKYMLEQHREKNV